MKHLSDTAFASRLREVANDRGLHHRDIANGRRRRGEISAARHDLMWRLKQDGYSLPEIGRVIGLDHTSVLNAIRVHEKRRAAE